jgi:hypothetical protein
LLGLLMSRLELLQLAVQLVQLLAQIVIFLQDGLEALLILQLEDFGDFLHQALHGSQLGTHLAQLPL